ncbi:MAG: hypothetical protein U1E14_06410 [Geminicoccaceae bacterium]
MPDDRRDDDAVTYAAREVLGVFHSHETLEAAVDELGSSGIDRSQINLLASRATAQEKLKQPVDDVRALASDPDAPVGVPIGPEEVTIGKTALAAGMMGLASMAAAGVVIFSGGTALAAIAAAIGAGGASGGIGLGLAQLFGAQHAAQVEDQLKHGGLLFWVTLKEQDDPQRVIAILERHGATEIRTQEARRHWGDSDIPGARMQPDPLLR